MNTSTAGGTGGDGRRAALLAGPILPTLLRLSLPNIVAMLATATVAIAETTYVGRLGTAALAGIALVFPMVMLQQMLSSGAMGGGVSSAVSRALGSGDSARAATLAIHAIAIGLSAGLFFSILFLVAGREIYRLLGGSGAALEQALAYSNVVFIGATSIWLTNTLASIVRGTGNMRVPSATMLGIASAQILIGGAFGLGLGPFPRLGMAGVAIGPLAAFTGGAMFLAWYIGTGRSGVPLSLRGQRLQWPMFRDILKVGAVACASPFQSVLAILILTSLAARFGTEALAGYGIGARLEFLLVPITFAIGVACVPMVGMAIGANDVPRARRVTWTGGLLSAVMMGALGMLMAAVPSLWATQFTSEPRVVEAASTYLRWAGPCYGFFGLGLCLYFAAQGSGKILGPVLAQTLRLLIILCGGWWLASIAAPPWALFALVGFGMVVYGLSTALSIHLSDWSPRLVASR